MSDGWDIVNLGDKVAIPVPPGTKINVEDEWVSVFTWPKGSLAEGPTILEFELAWKTQKPRPSDIQARLSRNSADGITKRQTIPVSVIESGAYVFLGLEFITPDDLPIALQLWQKGSEPLVVVKCIAKAHNPTAYIAGRLR